MNVYIMYFKRKHSIYAGGKIKEFNNIYLRVDFIINGYVRGYTILQK